MRREILIAAGRSASPKAWYSEARCLKKGGHRRGHGCKACTCKRCGETEHLRSEGFGSRCPRCGLDPSGSMMSALYVKYSQFFAENFYGKLKGPAWPTGFLAEADAQVLGMRKVREKMRGRVRLVDRLKARGPLDWVLTR